MRYSLLAAAVALTFTTFSHAADPLVVHEWGTFTSLQDEKGTSLGRINTDDEPVPAFVHTVASAALFPPTAAFTSDAKGSPAGDPMVCMRLETPVLYFHPPKNLTTPITVDVKVAFNGGWLTQYYPNASAAIDGAANANAPPPLTDKTIGRLTWSALTINPTPEQARQPSTTDAVWTAPRNVNSAPVAAGNEREQFLFYRGVGHLEAPLRVIRNAAANTLEIHAATASFTAPRLWLVDSHPDGTLAFRPVAQVTPQTTASTPAEFPSADYSPGNLPLLRKDMHAALVAHGLFADEADALLNTWERSYFQNPGQRLFFIVPQSWTDNFLPLTLSTPADITRVMVGRIELITPAQRALLDRLAKATPTDIQALKEVTTAMTRLRTDPTRTAAYNALAGGHGDLKDLAVPVPSLYADYLALGRFRTALLLNNKEPALTTLAEALVP